MIAVRSFFFCALCTVLCALHSDVAFCSLGEGIDSPTSTHDESVSEDAALDFPGYVDDYVDNETHTADTDVSDSDESEIIPVDQQNLTVDEDEDADEDTDKKQDESEIMPADQQNPTIDQDEDADKHKKQDESEVIHVDKQNPTVDQDADKHKRQDVVGRRHLWPYRETLWYKDIDRDGENIHLPYVQSVEDLYKHAFYCAIANNVLGLHALIGELRTLGEELDFVLEELRTKDGDNLLLQAVKNGSIDVVRYLLSIGAEVDVADSQGNTPIDIAVSMGDIAIVNSIAEMQLKFKFEDGE